MWRVAMKAMEATKSMAIAVMVPTCSSGKLEMTTGATVGVAMVYRYSRMVRVSMRYSCVPAGLA